MKNTLAILVFGACLGVTPSAAMADVSPGNQREAASAFQAVDTQVRQTRQQGGLPRWSDPGQARALGRFWDIKTTLGAPPYRSADVPALLDIGDRAGAVFKTYVLFTPKAGTVPDTAANTTEYQDEISRAGAYLVYVQAAALDALADFVRTLPADQMNAARRAGLRQMRLGITEQVTGLTLMLRSPSLRVENREVLLDALSENAGTLAAATPLADRQAMTAQVDALLPGLSDAERNKVLAIKSAFSSKHCTGLCSADAQ